VTAVQSHSRIGRSPKPKALRVMAVLCVALVVLLAVAQVMHVHTADTDADHCPLCIAMHNVLPFLVLMLAVLLVRIACAPSLLLEVRAVSRYWHPILFNRPPPAGC
jgi:hypothetical protein